ncbi:hypothetical protein CCR75_008505 [Bremia lactucae]|uniref:RING-type domain-containing protein n=1 Tax=Bremia lactucae TaxID=4779 RepID=A0A976FI61_BRELC|nr:hypothetical protein CCR75_008505 [Bremia lactucae]
MGNSTSKKSGISSRRLTIGTREIEKYTQPTGLYPTCPWEHKAARRLILERKLAPRFPGQEAKEGFFTLECPICFMFYPGNLNVSSCCSKPICSECYLQIRPPQKPICCPFCNQEAFGVQYAQPPPAEMAFLRLIKKAKSPRRSSVIGIPKRAVPLPAASSLQSVHYASVEDRDRIRDSLRSQLSISDKPVTDSPHPNNIAALNDAASHLMTTPADAARLEELMLLEAIRRSMQEFSVDKNGEERSKSQSSHHPTKKSGEHGTLAGYADLLPISASQITTNASGTMPCSSSSSAESSQNVVRRTAIDA